MTSRKILITAPTAEVGALISGGMPISSYFSKRGRSCEPYWICYSESLAWRLLQFFHMHLVLFRQLEGSADMQVPKLVLAWTEESQEKDGSGQPLVSARLQPYQGPLKYDRMAEYVRMMSSMISASAAEWEPPPPTGAYAPAKYNCW